MRDGARAPKVVPPGAGRRLLVIGHDITVKLDAADTGGDAFIFEASTPPGLGVPPHVHEREDEYLDVLEGTYEVFLGGETHRVGAGSVLHFPRRVPHGFTNAGVTTGRILFTVAPGARFARFFDDLAALPPGPPDFAKVTAIFAGYDMTILPPPAR